MQQNLQITFKDIPHSPAIEARIRKRIAKLDRKGSHLISCHVVVHIVQNHPRQAKEYVVEVIANVPGRQFIANKNRDVNLWKALRLAVTDVQMQLKKHQEQLHKKIKAHPEILHGEIVRLFDDFGFILAADGVTEYYFNSSHLVWPRFNKLTIGSPVHFIEFVGDDGPQARRVSAKRHVTKAPLYVRSLIMQEHASRAA